MKSMYWKYFFRITLSLLVSFGFGFLISEGSFFVLNQGEPPENQEFILVIPSGTADRIEKGLSVPSIPENMVFYEGDRLTIKNEDVVSHQLGPIWVPAGSTGKLDLGQQQRFTISCSFRPNKSLGLDVRQKTGSETRAQGVLAIGLPSSVLLFLFSIVLKPVQSSSDADLNKDE